MDRPRPLTTDRYRTRTRRASLIVAALTLLASFALGTPPATAASHRLSQGLPFSDVGGWEVSPDGQFAVYIHDAELDDARELWSVRVTGGVPVRLSNPLPGGVSVDSPFEISADSQRVVYRVAQETAGQVELYSVPIAGPEGAWIKLNGELPAGGDVSRLRISPDSARVIYYADQQMNDVEDAWTVPIDGGTPTRLRPFVTLAGSRVLYGQETPIISPDSERVLFYANFSNLAYFDLWSARVDGTGGLVQLTETTADLTDVTNPGVSPDSSRVLYFRFLNDNLVQELYSVPSAGGSAVKLNGALTPGGTVWNYRFSPDSTRVVYFAAQQSLSVNELYSVPLTGGGATKLNDVLPFSTGVASYAISPDGSRVVYSANQDTADSTELYSVPLVGGAVTKLNPPLPTGGDIAPPAVTITPDSSRVVYLADQRLNDVQEAFSVPLAGGPSVRVSDDPAVGGDVTEFEIAPGSDFVFYRADLLTDGVHELFRGRIAGISGADDRVSGAMVSGGEVKGWAVLPDGRQAIYLADQEVDEQDELYVGDPCLLCDGFEAGDSGRWD